MVFLARRMFVRIYTGRLRGNVTETTVPVFFFLFTLFLSPHTGVPVREYFVHVHRRHDEQQGVAERRDRFPGHYKR